MVAHASNPNMHKVWVQFLSPHQTDYGEPYLMSQQMGAVG